jgi:hypothetical protein
MAQDVPFLFFLIINWVKSLCPQNVANGHIYLTHFTLGQRWSRDAEPYWRNCKLIGWQKSKENAIKYLPSKKKQCKKLFLVKASLT